MQTLPIVALALRGAGPVLAVSLVVLAGGGMWTVFTLAAMHAAQAEDPLDPR